MDDIDRDRFMTPAEAVAYGLIDDVLEPRRERGRRSSIGLMRALGIHHVGVAVEDLDRALETYADVLGATLEHRAELADQGVEAAAVLVGPDRVELLAPTGDGHACGEVHSEARPRDAPRRVPRRRRGRHASVTWLPTASS